MRQKLKKASIKHYNHIFKLGRKLFPKSQYKTISFTGEHSKSRVFYDCEGYSIYRTKYPSYPLFTASQGVQIRDFGSVCKEAEWSE